MVEVRVQPQAQVAGQVRALHTLLAVNAILPLPIQELLAHVEQELEANPALERQEYPCAQCGAPVDGVVCARCGYTILGGLGRLNGERVVAAAEDQDDDDPFRSVAQPESFTEYLEGALAAHLTDPIDLKIGRYLIGCLDHRGYFDGQTALAAAELKVSEAAVRRVLGILQTLDPPGVGAGSLQECLMIQLRGLPASPVRDLAMRIVAGHLEAIACDQSGRIAKALGVSAAAVQAALVFMRRHLYPSPAECFESEHGGDALRPAEAALPDVVLRRTREGYRIEITASQAAALRVNPVFRDLLLKSRSGASTLSAAECEALREQVRKARLFIETVRRRTITLYNCVEQIVTAQREFLDHGPARLKPLTMRDVAAALGINESTVSRALDGKFVEFPDRRVVSFQVFFDRSTPVKERIRTLVESEDNTRPLTDSQLARILTAEGHAVARRTVAKYREEIRLPASSKRRKVRRHRAARLDGPARRVALVDRF